MRIKSSLPVTVTLLFAITLILGTITAFKPFQDKKPWIAPDKYSNMVNPQQANEESIKKGNELFVKRCVSCHGKTGHGDGTRADKLKTEPADLSSPDTQKQPDGSLFYKISEGRDDMPSFRKKNLNEEDIWNVINYIRTFKS